jgi:hypothetical protein
LPELVSQLMSLLCADEPEQKEVLPILFYCLYQLTITLKTGVRTTGELCRKFGERLLGEMVNILRTKSSSPDSQTRECVCLLLSELM